MLEQTPNAVWRTSHKDVNDDGVIEPMECCNLELETVLCSSN